MKTSEARFSKCPSALHSIRTSRGVSRVKRAPPSMTVAAGSATGSALATCVPARTAGICGPDGVWVVARVAAAVISARTARESSATVRMPRPPRLLVRRMWLRFDEAAASVPGGRRGPYNCRSATSRKASGTEQGASRATSTTPPPTAIGFPLSDGSSICSTKRRTRPGPHEGLWPCPWRGVPAAGVWGAG